jgi:hypothetical protein
MNLNIDIDGPRALELLVHQVRDRETFVYEKVLVDNVAACTYERCGSPSCLIGHALHEAGVPLAVLRDCDEHKYNFTKVPEDRPDFTFFSGTGISNLDLEQIGVRLTPKARAIFVAAQETQDHGLTWGEALAHAVCVSDRWGDET